MLFCDDNVKLDFTTHDCTNVCRVIRLPWYIGKLYLSFSYFSVQQVPNCANDSVTIYDANGVPHSQANKLCGRTQFTNINGVVYPFSQVFTITGNEAVVVFNSDSNVVDQGFTVQWLSDAPPLFEAPVGTIAHRNYGNSEYFVW